MILLLMPVYPLIMLFVLIAAIDYKSVQPDYSQQVGYDKDITTDPLN